MWGKYSSLEGPLTKKARELGYLLLAHGSFERDLDLIAVPWIEDCASVMDLAEAICEEARKITGIAFLPPDRFPRPKPHRRYSWSFCLNHDPNGPYIDLSVVSR